MNRDRYLRALKGALRNNPVVALVGPRQCGKTTLARLYLDDLNTKAVHYFDLERPRDIARLANPELVLSPLKGLVVIDEIQRRPDLFPTLRYLVDRPKTKTKFLILGSASGDLLAQASESLAGRIHTLELSPFQLSETKDLGKLWLRGGYPKSYLARGDTNSFAWREDYIRTYLERDLPNLGLQLPPNTMRRFWMMLTHYHAQTFNASEIGQSLGVSDQTARRYLDVLTSTFMVRQLQPWFANISKRQVKTPKIYITDTGLLHALLDIENRTALESHPKVGASWEGLCIENVIRSTSLRADKFFFWATHADAELDLYFETGGKRIGVEVKYTDQPKVTKSMRIAKQDLGLDSIFVVYPGNETFQLDHHITAAPIGAMVEKWSKFSR